ncbi:hypothetical protein K4F52_001829 [Lecanicillium sp. MT-2017a]|nr:hypothetical protein K4F52_001829 [Lecanicillium sp. MT-2017a]
MAPPTVAASSQSRPAGYGQSCTNCSRTKCKCILPVDGGACERCRRLGKTCQPIDTARRKTTKKATASRTAQLEEKLDDLVSILKSSQTPQSHSHSQSSALPPSQSRPQSHSQPPPQQQTQYGQQQQPQQLQNNTSAFSSVKYLPTYPEKPNFTTALDSLAHAASSERQVPGVDYSAVAAAASGNCPHMEPSPQQAEDALAKFRTWLPNFPFVHLPPAMTAAALRTERPFLWLSIMTFSVTSYQQHQYLRERVRREISERVIINHERTMDILLGLIAYLGWTALNTGAGAKPFVVLYTQLATLMVNELGLLRPPNEEHFSAIGWKTWKNSPYVPRARTTEERRAVLAVWFLSSLANAFTARAETLPWTPHLDECLEMIERGEDQAPDQMLATLVKIQRIIDEAHRYLVYDLMPAPKGGAKTPTYLHKPGLLERLKNVRKEIPDRYSYNSLVAMLSLGAEAQIHAVGLFSGNKMPDTQSVESMYQSITCTKSFYDTFFAIPVTEVPGLPFYVYVAHSSVQFMLYRLTIAENPSWDKEIIRSTVDVMAVIDRSIEMFENIADGYPGPEHEIYTSLFRNGAKYMRNLRVAWQPAVARQYGNLPTPNSQQDMSQSVQERDGVGVNNYGVEGSMMPTIDFNDISWMADIFGPWQM